MLLNAIPNLYKDKTEKEKEKLKEIHSGERDALVRVSQLEKKFPYGRGETIKSS